MLRGMTIIERVSVTTDRFGRDDISVDDIVAIAPEAMRATQVPSSRCPGEKLLIVIQKKISETVSSGAVLAHVPVLDALRKRWILVDGYGADVFPAESGAEPLVDVVGLESWPRHGATIASSRFRSNSCHARSNSRT